MADREWTEGDSVWLTVPGYGRDRFDKDTVIRALAKTHQVMPVAHVGRFEYTDGIRVLGYHCPVCNNRIGESLDDCGYMAYCPFCGQAFYAGWSAVIDDGE